jgi:8-oxo-dGTP diphosphatase
MDNPIQVVAGVLQDAQGRVLVARRAAGTHLAGTWEFPGGKIEPGESPAQALRRELHEELGVDVGAVEPLIRVPWRYPAKAIVLHALRVIDYRGEPHAREHEALQWIAPRDALDLEMPPPDVPIVTALRLPRHYAITSEPAETGVPKVDSTRAQVDSTRSDPIGIVADEAAVLTSLDSLLASGIRLVQLRIKRLSGDALARIAAAAAARARTAGATLLLNGHAALALALDLDGVHLPSSELMTLAARPLDRDRWVAASCHDERELAQAARIGIDFAVLGPVQPTVSHPHAAPMGWKRFGELCAAAPFPVYALGGLRADDLQTAVRFGAQGIAGISMFPLPAGKS